MFSKIARAAIVAIGIATTTASADGPELIIDGGFETAVFGGCPNECFTSCGFGIAPWIRGGFYTEDLYRNTDQGPCVETPVNPSGGQYFVSVQGSVCCGCNNNGSITQTLELVPGNTYRVRLDIEIDDYDAVLVSCGLHSMRLDPTNTPTNVWATASWEFVADVYSTSLKIEAIGGGAPNCLSAYNSNIDNISVRLAEPNPPSINLVGPADLNSSTCAAIGDLVTYDVIVNNPTIVMVAGQFGIQFDKTVLEFVSLAGGDAPITTTPLVVPNTAAGKLFWVSSVVNGGTGTAATTRVARVTFRVIADDCNGDEQVSFDPAMAPILLADGNGTSADLPTVNPLPITIDSVGPVITNVPADLVVAADAGAGCLAVREIGTPTVTDSCSTAALTWSRSDGAALLSAPWLCGTTVVTWTATDACGRTSTATTSVTVNSYHLMNVTVAYAGTGYASSMTRCIGFRVDDVTLTDVMTFMSGTATATLQLPIGDYNCATADDDLHSLVSQVPVSINGTNYQMNVTGDSALINGDLDDDNVVNVVDWGVLVVRVGMAAAVNTDCTTVGFHADFDGDGTVTNADGNRLLQSFLVQGDTGCNAFNANSGPVVTRISVADLSVIAGMNASAADMNRDGVVDAKDIAMWTRLQSMPGRQPLTAKGVSSRN